MQRSFIGGEIAPALGARADLRRYLSGLKLCRNCWVRREGGVMNRPGTRFVAAAGDSTERVRLVPFVFEGADQTYVLEFGHQYVRFFWHGAAVLDGAAAYELVTPYAGDDLAALQFIQSADVLTLTHAGYAPRELRRNDHTSWELVTLTLGAGIDAPANPIGTAGASGSRTIRYVITSSKAGTFEESAPSAVIELTTVDEGTVDEPHALECDPVADAGGYYVYKDPHGNGIFGWIGEAAGPSFSDVGFAPDFTITPPIAQSLFTGAGDWPGVATYYQQRRLFARSTNAPETVWTSRVGAYHNFNISTPLQDDDAVTFVIASRELNPVQHLVPLKRLMVLTNAGEWLVRGDENGTLRPTSINADQEGYVGAHPDVRPVVIGNALVYAQARGTAIRDIRFETEPGALGSRDVTVVARHLFEGRTVKAIAWQQEPHHLLWVVLDNGTLVAATYNRDEEILAWSRHDTDGLVEDAIVVPDTPAGEDVLYLIVKRTIDGVDLRYIERLASRAIDADDLAGSAFFVDSGLTYDGAAVGKVTGLDHLEGEIVAVLADGQVLHDGDPDADDAESFRVSDGEIDLPVPASVVHAGLPIRFPEIETLALDVEGATVRDKKKLVQRVTVLLETSGRDMLAGLDAAHLSKVRPEPTATSSPLRTGDVEITIASTWDKAGRVRLRHTQPLPWHVLAVIPHVEVGG